MNSSNIWLLSVGLLAVIVMIVLTASARRVVAIGVLLAFIPFQIVSTRFSSSSVLMAYAMAGTLLLIGGLRLRLLPAIGIVLLAYAMSMSQAKHFMTLHAIEIFQFFSCFIVFLLAYNYARLVKSERSITDVLIVINVMVVIYCVLQIAAGAGQAFKPFGIDALAFNSNRDVADSRLIGPFANPGTTAGYFTLMTIYWVAELISAEGGRRRIVQALILANVACIVATGNRASFMVLMAGLPALLVYFRRELGPRRVFQYLIGGITVVVLASATIAVYSGFGNMFRRLSVVTETEDGLPTTRSGTWTMAFEKIRLHPWFGEGPHYMSPEDAEMMGILRAQYESLSEVQTAFDPYPHSLYLYLLRTVGVVGLAAMLWFFANVLLELRRGAGRQDIADYPRSMIKAGIVMIGAFLVTQITLEFNRTGTLDYGQFVFALMGFFIGVADRPATAGAVAVPVAKAPMPAGLALPPRS